MAREEIGPLGGVGAMAGVLMIMVILIAVLGLVVTNALKQSPWGTFTVGATIPIAMLMGWYMRLVRPGAVGEATVIGLVLLGLAVVGGRSVDANPAVAAWFTFSGPELALMIIAY